MAEILSPAGSPEHAEAAVKSGADAVYLGLKKFSARGGARNFDASELSDTVSFCHRRGVKVYAAVNTILFDDELGDLAETLRLLCSVGADAVIIQDLAAVSIAKKCCPGLELHASTQMTLHTRAGLEFAQSLGFKRAVLSRELPEDIIKELCGAGIETEIFVHGALCMSVSGQCLMSAVAGGRSANRGMCAQPCRLPCSVRKGGAGRDHALSLKDMCYFGDLQRLAGYGADSLKIEGRMKRPEYAALTADCAVKALGGEEYDRDLLKDVFSRGGFTDGYLYRKTGAQMFGMRTAEDAKTASSAYPKIHELYRREYKRGRLSFFVSVKNGEPLRVSAEDENGLRAETFGDLPQPAENRPCTEDLVRRCLEKLGDTFYTLDKLECDIDGGLAVSAAALNNARREVTAKIGDLREGYFSKTTDFDIGALDLNFGKRQRGDKDRKVRLRVNALRAEQLKEISDVELAYLPLSLSELKKAAEFFPIERLGAAMPRFTFDEQHDTETLRRAAEMGIRHVLCTNFAHLETAARLGLTAHAAAGLNTSNSLALEQLSSLGAADAVASAEMRASQINALSTVLPVGAAGYGRLALMLTVNCPIRAAVGCKKCTKRIFDRTGREFPVKCSKSLGYVEILNCDTLCISDKTDDFWGADFFQLELFDETPERAARIADIFREKKPYPFGGNVTRGLYYRGLKR